jgi:hypothetical protein
MGNAHPTRLTSLLYAVGIGVPSHLHRTNSIRSRTIGSQLASILITVNDWMSVYNDILPRYSNRDVNPIDYELSQFTFGDSCSSGN